MTLVVALVCSDGIVVASDSKQTFGDAPLTRQSAEEPKTKVMRNHIVFAGAGSLTALQEVEEEIEKLVDQRPSASAHDLIPQVKVAVHEVTRRNLDMARALQGDDVGVTDIPQGVVLLCSYDSKPYVYQIFPDGQCARSPRYCTIGSSFLYAELILKDFYRTDMTCQEAAFLAYYTLRQASEVDPYVGGPIHIHKIMDGSVARMPDEELEALEDDFQIRQAVLKILFSNWRKLSPKIYEALGELEPSEDEPTSSEKSP